MTDPLSFEKSGSKGGAIARCAPSLSPSVEPIYVVSPASLLRSTIAEALPHRFIIYALAALCIAADVAIWRAL